MIRRAALLASAAAGALLVGAAPARADPFSLTAIVASSITAATAGAVSGIGATALASIAIGAVTIGAGYLLTALFASSQKPENGTVAALQPIPYRTYAFGQCAPPGATLHIEASGDFLGVVNCICAHEIDDFVGLYFNDDQVTILQDGQGDIAGYSTSATDGRYRQGYISLDSRKGKAGQSWMGGVGNAFPSTWPATSTGQGLALLSMVCVNPPKSKANLFTTYFPYAQPKPRPIIRAAKVWDPRVASQSPDDPSTWAWSDSAILNLIYWRCFSPFGSLLPYRAAILPTLAAWIQAANDCDDQMPLKSGGNERRYRLGGYNTTEQDRRSTTAAILAACDGWMIDRGDGSVDVQVGKYVDPTVVLTDDDILGYQVARGTATKDKINRITARYTSPDNQYVSVETQPMDDTADQALRFGPPRAAQLDVTWCQWTGQASRLQKREFIRQGRKTRGTLVLRLTGLNAMFERRVLVRSNTIPRLSNTVIEVAAKPTLNLSSNPPSITLTFFDNDSSIDAYDPNVDESPAPFVPQRPAASGLPIPANVSAVFAGAGSLTVSWDPPYTNGSPDYTFSYFVQVRIAAVGSAPAGQWVQQEFITPTGAGRLSVTTSGGPTGPAGTELDVQVITESASGQIGQGSDITQVVTK